ncbi:hypothetical protein AB0M86_26900 [Streptomyces sp. NPDC051639]|nr:MULTISPECIES: hypothetical protein [unclassified Streptomyces]QIY66980.1 hypothetical protein HEP85_42915 [Streptomyces sp. RPA4-2]
MSRPSARRATELPVVGAGAVLVRVRGGARDGAPTTGLVAAGTAGR